MAAYVPKLTNEADNGKCGETNLKDRVLKIEELIKKKFLFHQQKELIALKRHY